jgi:inositol polyphosphate 5-phosphatase INPP5J/K
MQGLLLIIFVKRKHLYHIREIESEYTRTGFGGMWVSIKKMKLNLSFF